MSVSAGFRVNQWLVEPSLGRMSCGGDLRHLEPQVMKVLVYLSQRPGEVITRDELFAALWPNSVVHDMALTRCITQIRRAFGDRREHPEVIETIPKQGYRLIARVSTRGVAAIPAVLRVTLRRHWLAAASAAAVFLLILVAPVTGSLNNGAVKLADTDLVFRDRASVFYDRGRQFYGRYNYEDNESAIVMFERAIDESVDFSLAYSGLSNALALKAYYWGGETVNRADRAAQKAIRLDPLSGEAYNAMGLVQALRGEFDAAVESQHQALALKPDFWQAAQNLGSLYFQQFQHDKAANWFRRSIDLNPENTTAMRDLGHIHLLLGDLDNAKYWLESVHDRLPLHRGAVRSLADLAIVQGQYAEAVERCGQLLRSYPDDVPCLQSSAVAAYMAGDYDWSEKYYDLMINTSPGHLYAFLGQAQLAARKGNQQRFNELLFEVEQNAQLYLRENGPRWNLSWVLAAAHAQKGEKEEAIQWLGKTLETGRAYYMWDSLDPALTPLHGDPAFEAYIETMRKRAMAALRSLPGSPSAGRVIDSDRTKNSEREKESI